MFKDKKSKVIAVILLILALLILSFLCWFYNRKFEISFDLNNNTSPEVIKVKYNKLINKDDVKEKNELGETFIGWFQIIGEKDGEDVLSDKEFDFSTKIVENIKLKAVYKGEEVKETITITFDSKGGSKVNPITINKGEELNLPKNPTLKGNTFKSWTNKNGKVIHNKAILNEDTTLYAKWEKVKATVKEETPKEEKISLSLSRNLIHALGTNTSKATATVENSTGDVTYSLSDETCMTINEKTGDIKAKSKPTSSSGLTTYNNTCAKGQKVTVTAKTAGGKTATQVINYEQDLILVSMGNTYEKNSSLNGGSDYFLVTSNVDVTWKVEMTSVPSYKYSYEAYINKSSTLIKGDYVFDTIVASTGGISRVTGDVKVTATSKTGQKITLVIHKSVA